MSLEEIAAAIIIVTIINKKGKKQKQLTKSIL